MEGMEKKEVLLMRKNKYNMRLMKKLNKEYEGKKVMDSFPLYNDDWQLETADRRIDYLKEKMNFEGKKILEIGCGGGYTIYRLAQRYHCTAVGIDIYNSPVWERNTCDNLSYICVDLSKENPFEEEEFDYIISYVAWEHMYHPFEVLQQAAKLLKRESDGGMFYLSANLYRSAIASHLYREIYFPYPQLLFDEETIVKFALKKGTEKEFIDAFFHLNKLTYAEYKEYFRILNLSIKSESQTIRELDREFYHRFEDKLGYYPISDLELDFFAVFLTKQAPTIIRRHFWIEKVQCKMDEKQNSQIDVICETYGEKELEYAWYIYKNEERVDTVWYKKDNKLTYCPKESGEYCFLVFARDKSGKIKSKKTDVMKWRV